MKLAEFSLDWYRPLEKAWLELAPKREDAARNAEMLAYLLFEDGSTHFYQVPNHDAWFYLRNIIPRLSAEFFFLSLEPLLSKRDTKLAMQEAMREFDLRRLTLTVPAPVNPKFYQSLGFVQEGRLRDSTIYNDDYCDVIVLGFHRSEVEKNALALTDVAKVDKKTRKRRRRSRRKKKVADQENLAEA